MMRFRKGGRRFSKRSRSKYEMLPLTMCPLNISLTAQPQCDDPDIIATELQNTTGRIPNAGVSGQRLSNGLIIKNWFFQYKYQTLGYPELGAYGFITVRSALVRLEVSPTTFAPVFLPNLFSPNEPEIGSRILWRRDDTLVMWDSVNSPVLSFFSTDLLGGVGEGSGLQRVRTACKVTETQGIFFVSNFIHNFTIPLTNAVSFDFFGTAAVHNIPG